MRGPATENLHESMTKQIGHHAVSGLVMVFGIRNTDGHEPRPSQLDAGPASHVCWMMQARI